MSSLSSRARWTVAVASAFVGGLLLASSLNWTRLGFAQPRTSQADVRPITDINNAFVEIADRVTPAVVSIQVETKTHAVSRSGSVPTIPKGMIPPGMQDFFNLDTPQQPIVQEASGSGFIVSKDGYILTNNHVVTGADHNTIADKITVQLLGQRRYTARVIGHDPTTDIAVIKIDGNDFPTIPLGDDAKARVGEWVLAIGNPLGLDFTVTAGIVSAKGRSLPGLLGGNRYAISDLLQTDAAINPGNSGGPLVNAHGEVIGVNSAIASQTGYYSGYGFAIPITLAKRVMDDLVAHGHVRFGVLGVAIGEVDADAAAVAGLQNDIRGALVSSFTPDNDDNPAKKAGIQIGDVIISADGHPVDRVSALQRVVRSHAPGESVNVEVMRYGQKKSFSVKLMERPSDAQLAADKGDASEHAGPMNSTKLGVQLTQLPDKLPSGFPSHGVMIADVEALGPAYGKLFQNDVITDILYPTPRRPVQSMADLQKALGDIKQGGYISLNVFAPEDRNGGVTRIVNIRLGQ